MLTGESLLALVATPSRLYVFIGGPGLAGLFAGYASRSVGARLLRPRLWQSSWRCCRHGLAEDAHYCCAAGIKSQHKLMNVQVSASHCILTCYHGGYEQASAASNVCLYLLGATHAELMNMVEQPLEHADGASGRLAMHTRPGLTTADRYAWLADAGPLTGRLNMEPDTGTARDPSIVLLSSPLAAAKSCIAACRMP